jgi:hypothetical protein
LFRRLSQASPVGMGPGVRRILSLSKPRALKSRSVPGYRAHNAPGQRNNHPSGLKPGCGKSPAHDQSGTSGSIYSPPPTMIIFGLGFPVVNGKTPVLAIGVAEAPSLRRRYTAYFLLLRDWLQSSDPRPLRVRHFGRFPPGLQRTYPGGSPVWSGAPDGGRKMGIKTIIANNPEADKTQDPQVLPGE